MKVEKDYRIKSRIELVLLLLSVIVVILFLCPIPIHKEYTCLEIKLDDPFYQRECVVSVDGLYYLNIFSADSFDGDLLVSSYAETKGECGEILCTREGWPLFYNKRELNSNGNAEEFCLGKLVSTRLFQKFVICVYSDNPSSDSDRWKESGDWGVWNDINGYCIVPNCSTYERAVEIISSLGIILQ